MTTPKMPNRALSLDPGAARVREDLLMQGEIACAADGWRLGF